MSDEIKKICKNCDNLQYGFGESSISYGPRCFEKDCEVDENDTCNMFEVASYLKVKKLQEQNKILKEALEFYAEIKNYDYIEQYNNTFTVIDPVDCERFVDKWHDITFIGGKRAREALAKVDK